MIKVSASIVIYNEKKETLKKVVESFLNLNFKKELIIVDNSKNNTLEEFFKQYNKELTYIFNNKNLGFAKAHNLAFSNLSIDSNIHLILNPDIYFDTNITAFIYWFSNAKDTSLAVTEVLNPDTTMQKTVRNIPTPLGLIKRRLHINYDEINIQKNKIIEIPFAHGCFLAFKSKIFRKINGFDEIFFMYMEDLDIFIRSKKYGKTLINTNYHIYHEYRKESSKNLKLLCWHIISAIKFFYKYR